MPKRNNKPAKKEVKQGKTLRVTVPVEVEEDVNEITLPEGKNRGLNLMALFSKIKKTGDKIESYAMEDLIFVKRLSDISMNLHSAAYMINSIVDKGKAMRVSYLESFNESIKATEIELSDFYRENHKDFTKSFAKIYKDFKNNFELIKDGVNYYLDLAGKEQSVMINAESEELRMEPIKKAEEIKAEKEKLSLEKSIRTEAAENLNSISKWMKESNKSWFTKQSKQFEKLRGWVETLRNEIKVNGISKENAPRLYCIMCSVYDANNKYVDHCEKHKQNNTVRKLRTELSRLVGEEVNLIYSLPEIQEAKQTIKNNKELFDQVKRDFFATKNEIAERAKGMNETFEREYNRVNEMVNGIA